MIFIRKKAEAYSGGLGTGAAAASLQGWFAPPHKYRVEPIGLLVVGQRDRSCEVFLDETLAPLADRRALQINGKTRVWFEIDRPRALRRLGISRLLRLGPVAPSAVEQRVVEHRFVVVLAHNHDDLVPGARINDPRKTTAPASTARPIEIGARVSAAPCSANATAATPQTMLRHLE